MSHPRSSVSAPKRSLRLPFLLSSAHYAGLTIGLGGVACLHAEAEVGNVCFLETGVVLERSAPSGPLAGSTGQLASTVTTLETSFSRDGLSRVPEALEDIGARGEIHLSFAEVFATEGLASFGAVARVTLELRPTDPSSTLSPLMLAVCDRSQGCDTASDSVVLHGPGDRDLMPYLREDDLTFTLQLTAPVSADRWTFDVDVCMKAHGSYVAEL